MFTSLIVRLVDLSRRFAAVVVLLALVLAGGCGWFAATHFKINTDVNQLLAADLPWRQQEKSMEKAFPQKVDTLLVVIDGDTPEKAETAAAALSEKLRAMPERFSMVARPDALPFFQKNGLLYLSKDALGDTLQQITQAQPLLGMLARDPTLRGFFDMIGLMAMGAQQGQTDPARLEQTFSAMADAIEAALAGQDKPLALQGLTNESSPHAAARKLILTRPVLDYSALEPGEKASAAIRAAAADLRLTPANGVHVRLTGSVALNDEEFASIKNGTSFATALSVVLVFVLLLIALRSLRIVLPILLTLTVGLAFTTAFALLAVGSLNLISVAFAVMFIGIAVDFGIQFGVRYRDQHHEEPDHAKAMTRAAAIVAVPLAMAAASTALGFFAFIPTAYRGVSELGLIAGTGMLIAYALNVTLLPALLTFSRPPAEPAAIGYRWLAPVDRFMAAHRKLIVVLAVLLALGGLAVAWQLRFDFDPINLKDPNTESVSTLRDLTSNPDFSPYTVDILRPSLAEAEALADQLGTLPQVDHAMTLASFVPEDQDAKRTMIADTRMLLEPSLSLSVAPAPTDDEVYLSANRAAAALHKLGEPYPEAARLAKALETAATRHDHDLLQRLQGDLVAPVLMRLAMIREILNPETIAPGTNPEELSRDWVTSDGRYLVTAYPKGDMHDQKTLIAFTEAVRAVAPDAAERRSRFLNPAAPSSALSSTPGFTPS